MVSKLHQEIQQKFALGKDGLSAHLLCAFGPFFY